LGGSGSNGEPGGAGDGFTIGASGFTASSPPQPARTIRTSKKAKRGIQPV
jgi:hypothetical protein